jgi:transposase
MDDPIQQDCPGCRKLAERVAQLEALVEQLQAALDRTQRALEEAQRSGKRQAAPFRKNKPAAPAKKPGRKPGDEHGHHAHRTVPPPDKIDELYDVPLPAACPHCGGRHLTEHGVRQQYQTEIPRQPIIRQFDIHLGCCNDCGGPVQGRHELQTSDALGAAASQLGPALHAALMICNKELGLSHGKARTLFERLFGIKISRAASIRGQLRLADKLRPSYGKISSHVRGSPWVVCDETGWRVEGENAWLHDFVTDRATLYWIDPTRSGEPAELILGEDYSGVMIHDGWSVYDRFTSARHQQCLAHLLRRCGELLDVARGAAARFPRAVKALLQRALGFRDRYRSGMLSRRGLKVFAGRLTAELRRLVSRKPRDSGHARFSKHLEKHADELFTFLREPEVDATNWRAEQAIRPAVVNRKVWGGNRTWEGANAQSILMSVLVTCGQQGIDALEFLATNLKSEKPLVIPILGR